MATWLTDKLTETTTKGGSSTTDTEDNVSATTNRGQRVTTKSPSGAQQTTVKEDAGGQISFVIPIRGGLFQNNPSPVCPAP